MSQFFIVLGDKTDHGGTVLEGSPADTIDGKPIARVGDKVHCPRSTCRGSQIIVEGDPGVLIDGKSAAFHGAKTSCGAVLIASQIDNVIGGSEDSGTQSVAYGEAASAAGQADSGFNFGSGGSNSSRSSDPEFERKFAEYNKKIHHDLMENFVPSRAFKEKKLTVIRNGNTVTLRGRATVYSNYKNEIRTPEFIKGVMSRWDGLSYEIDGVTYRTDIKLAAASSNQHPDIFLNWTDYSDEAAQATAQPNGTINFDTSRVPVITEGLGAHEFSHAFLGIKDAYRSNHLPSGEYFYNRPYSGFENSLMGSETGTVTPSDLKALITAYEGELTKQPAATK